MSYNLHITRRAEWHRPDSGPPITLDEFEQVVLGDARFRRDDELGREYAVLVKTPPGAELPPWFCWENGEIMTQSPLPSTVKLATEIAATLNARVIGDDGEEYGGSGFDVHGWDDQSHKNDTQGGDGNACPAQTAQEIAKRLRRERAVLILQWTGVAAFIALFVVLLGKQLGWW